MADSRELVYGLDFDLDTALQGLQSVLNSIGNIGEKIGLGEEAAVSLGNEVSHIGSQMAGGIQDTSQAFSELTAGIEDGGEAFSHLGEQAQSIGESSTGVETLSQSLQQAGADAQGVQAKLSDVGKAAGEIGGYAAQEFEKAAGAMEAAGETADTFRDKVAQSGHAAQDTGADVEDAADTFRRKFSEMGVDAQSFGSAFALSMGMALKDGENASDGIRAGFYGAFSYAFKQANAFTSKLKTGAAQVGTAFLHPAELIRNKLGGALLKVGTAADKLGKEADQAGKSVKGLGKDGKKYTDDAEEAAEDYRNELDRVGDAGGEAGNAIKEAFKGAVGSIMGIEAIKSGIDLLKNFVGAAFEVGATAENNAAKFDASFGDMAGEVGTWAENFGDAVHRSESEVKGFLTSNRAMYSEMGITGEAASELSKTTSSLAYDFGNAFSMADGDALSAVQEAIGGNAGALAEYGIQLDDATLKASALRMGLSDNIDEMDDASLAQVRLNALLEQSGDIQRAGMEQTGGLVNSTKSLKGIWDDFMAGAGAKFTPVLEKLFGAITDAWPRIEPMLFQFVDLLANGMGDAIPILLDLGTSLLPTVTDVIGTLFQAAEPLLPVIGELAKEVLPPLADVFGMLGETLIPPLVDILGVLTDSVFIPLMPIIESLAKSLLPPIAKLLENVGPMLEVISPVLMVIGDTLGVIGEVLGKVIGWVADGSNKVANFFLGMFGGAKDSKEGVDSLSDSIGSLGQAASKETTLAVDASQYQNALMGAADDTSSVLYETAELAKKTTGGAFQALGEESDGTYQKLADDSDTAWSRMNSSAKDGVDGIVSQFGRLEGAAVGVSSMDLNFSGQGIPHNARGTDHFEGGLTWLNEEGPELVRLPSGSEIVPADKTADILNARSSYDNRQSTSAQPVITINIYGNASQETTASMTEQLKETFRQLIREEEERRYARLAIQGGYIY